MSCQVKSGSVWLGQIKTSQFRSGQISRVESGLVKSGSWVEVVLVGSGWVRLGQLKSTQIGFG